jgi:hypothetical protein
MIELLIAATVTALVAGAAATFVSAASNASLTTRDVRAAQTDGHYSLVQIGRAIRQARAIGAVAGDSVTLWLDDTNKDDKVNLYETAVIRYDAANRQIVYEYLQPLSGPAPTTQVSTAALTDYSTLAPLRPAGDLQTVVWASNVSSASFTGNPNMLDTRMVEVRFSLDTNGQQTNFRVAAGPRPSADYLFHNETVAAPLPGSARKVRKVFSRWNGFTDVTNGADPIAML